MKKLYLYYILFYSCLSYSQDTIIPFSQAIKNNITNYVSKSDFAFSQNNTKEGENLFTSLVNNKLIGTRFDNTIIETLSSKKINLEEIKKPLLIITYASWCVINKGDIPALNKLAKDYEDDLKIVILFWGDKTETKKISKQFNNSILVGYTDFRENENYKLVYLLKNVIGTSTYYYVDSNKKVVDINRLNTSYLENISDENAINTSYENFGLIFDKDNLKSQKKNDVAIN